MTYRVGPISGRTSAAHCRRPRNCGPPRELALRTARLNSPMAVQKTQLMTTTAVPRSGSRAPRGKGSDGDLGNEDGKVHQRRLGPVPGRNLPVCRQQAGGHRRTHQAQIDKAQVTVRGGVGNSVRGWRTSLAGLPSARRGHETYFFNILATIQYDDHHAPQRPDSGHCRPP